MAERNLVIKTGLNRDECWKAIKTGLEELEIDFRCVHTPGYSLGHTRLYEPEKKILVAGDHVDLD